MKKVSNFPYLYKEICMYHITRAHAPFWRTHDTWFVSTSSKFAQIESIYAAVNLVSIITVECDRYSVLRLSPFQIHHYTVSDMPPKGRPQPNSTKDATYKKPVNETVQSPSQQQQICKYIYARPVGKFIVPFWTILQTFICFRFSAAVKSGAGRAAKEEVKTGKKWEVLLFFYFTMWYKTQLDA